jgi:hypothetical protein
MPTSNLSSTDLQNIAMHIKSVPTGVSPAAVIGFLSRKYDISESALSAAVTSIKSGKVPAAPAAATAAPAPILESEDMRRATEFKAQIDGVQARPLAEASTGDLYALTEALIPRR